MNLKNVGTILGVVGICLVALAFLPLTIIWMIRTVHKHHEIQVKEGMKCV